MPGIIYTHKKCEYKVFQTNLEMYQLLLAIGIGMTVIQ